MRGGRARLPAAMSVAPAAAPRAAGRRRRPSRLPQEAALPVAVRIPHRAAGSASGSCSSTRSRSTSATGTEIGHFNLITRVGRPRDGHARAHRDAQHHPRRRARPLGRLRGGHAPQRAERDPRPRLHHQPRLAARDRRRARSIVSGHRIDFTDRVTIGRNVIIGGRNSSLWTHNRQQTAPIEIGDFCYLGSEVRLAPGARLPERSILALGSVLAGAIDTPGLPGGRSAGAGHSSAHRRRTTRSSTARPARTPRTTCTPDEARVRRPPSAVPRAAPALELETTGRGGRTSSLEGTLRSRVRPRLPGDRRRAAPPSRPGRPGFALPAHAGALRRRMAALPRAAARACRHLPVVLRGRRRRRLDGPARAGCRLRDGALAPLRAGERRATSSAWTSAPPSTWRRAARARARTSSRPICASLRSPPESFDLVYSLGVVHHVADPAAAVRSLAALVRPGGTLRLYVYRSLADEGFRAAPCSESSPRLRAVTTRLPPDALARVLLDGLRDRHGGLPRPAPRAATVEAWRPPDPRAAARPVHGRPVPDAGGGAVRPVRSAPRRPLPARGSRRAGCARRGSRWWRSCPASAGAPSPANPPSPRRDGCAARDAARGGAGRRRDRLGRAGAARRATRPRAA